MEKVAGAVMYKVLIADDEKNVCMLIKKLIDWESMGLEVIDIVHNAVAAYECIRTRKPDIVISDIRMPGYDGLELIRKSIELGNPMDFIIISGYKYFEYAHKALGMGIEHYLLKPINQSELEEALQKIIHKKRTEEEKQQAEEELREEIYESQKKMKRHFLTSVMSQQNSNLDLIQMKEEFSGAFSENYFQAFFVKVDFPAEAGCNLDSLLVIIEGIIEKILAGMKCEYINSRMKSGIVTVLNFDAKNKDAIHNMYEFLMRQLIREMDKFNMFSVTVGVGGYVGTITDIRVSINSAVGAVKCRLKKGVNRLIFAEELNYAGVDIAAILNESEKKKLENMVDTLDSFAFHNFLEAIMQSVRKVTFYSPVAVYDMLENIGHIIMQTLKKNEAEEEQITHLQETIDIALDRNTDEENLVRDFENQVVSCMDQSIQMKKSRSQLPVRMAKQYIQEHYREQLSLEDVGNAINLSPAYLSTIFKKELGINFTDYIIYCRMEEAKELLKNSEKSIAEVAEQVGYSDSRYFSKLFVKVIGLKPSVYRKLYS